MTSTQTYAVVQKFTLIKFYLQCICTGRMKIDWNQSEKRLPLDLGIVAIGVIIHNVLSCAVFKERRRIENQELNALNLNGT